MFSFTLKAQLPQASKHERKWAYLHPFAALKVKKISRVCQHFYLSGDLKFKLDSFTNGGKLDAYRHIFFMACFAQKVKASKITKLGIAHEKANYQQFKKHTFEFGEIPDSLSTIMDLRNNELGVKIGMNQKKLSHKNLDLLVIETIKNGEAYIIKRNSSGVYLNCENQAIDLNNYQGKWSIPKCLVKSNFVYSD